MNEVAGWANMFNVPEGRKALLEEEEGESVKCVYDNGGAGGGGRRACGGSRGGGMYEASVSVVEGLGRKRARS